MKVASLIQRDLTSCTIHDDLQRAAHLMWERDVGCLPVIDDQGHVAGMITDRDVAMAAYTRGIPLRGIPITGAMARQVFSCAETAEVEVVERMMREHKVHRMPVIDDQGHPIGIISIIDLARAAQAGAVPPGDVTSTLAAVSAPRRVISSAT